MTVVGPRFLGDHRWTLIGLRQADASCGHGATQDAATRADLEPFRVMSGRSHGMTA